MDVHDIRIQVSPRASGLIRLRAEVTYDDDTVAPEELWFDVPESRADDLTTTGNPWLAALLPLASALGEPLRIERSVDAALLAGAHRLLRIWTAWYPQLSVVDVEADAWAEPGHDGRVAAFFSGGADSFFTVLRDRSTAPPRERAAIDDLITVHGFDIPLDAEAAFGRLSRRHTSVAERLGLGLVEVSTNLRTTRWRNADWSYLAHGAGLAALALSLGRAYSTVYIAGGGGYRGLHPWGSHSVTDPLFSTMDTAVVYDAASWIRTEKLEAIATSPLVRESLRVCYQNEDDQNCGTCSKCLRTMITLEICGVLDQFPTFPTHSDLLGAVADMDGSYFADAREIEDIRRFADAQSRIDILRVLDRCARRSIWRARARASRRLMSGAVKTLIGLLNRTGR